MISIMSITLRDVAEKANVSPSTVSRILNNKDSKIPISEETRQRVLQAAQDVGYKPNMAARHLAQRQSFALIGAIVPKTVPAVLAHPFYMLVLHGIAQHCQEKEYAVAIYFVDTDQEEMVANVYPRIANIPADGFILTSVKSNDRLVPRFQADNIPFVQIGRTPEPEQTPLHFVDVDNYGGAVTVVTHLIQRGHQKIATITGPQDMAAGIDRLRGYQDCLQQAGISHNPEWIASGNFEPESGYTAMQQLLQAPDLPTAVFAASDSMADGAYKAIQEHNLRIPEDIAMIGFDDNKMFTNNSPPLTTMRQPISQLGENAACLLLHLLSDNAPSDNIILQPELILRQST
jgi:LacI family transcriptional regulator